MGRMAKAFAQRGQPANRAVQRISLAGERLPVHFQRTVVTEHLPNLGPRETGRAAQRDHGQLLQHLGLVLAAQAMPRARGNQALGLVVTQGGSGEA